MGIGSQENVKNPSLICAPVMADSIDKMVTETCKAHELGVDLVEIRLDWLKDLIPLEDLKTIIKKSTLPTLFTTELNPSLLISNFAYGEEDKEEELNMGFDEQEEVNDFNEWSYSDDDEFEHYDVIEKLKTELRNARTGGLCTILEESETPLQELKPLKIEPTPDQFKDRISEIHKVYKNYAVKMRKLDIIDSQTMHSISRSCF